MTRENQSEDVWIQWTKELTRQDTLVLEEVVKMVKEILATDQRPA